MPGPFLSQLEPFNRLNPAEKRHLAAASREKAFKKGETVFRVGDPALALCVLRKGRIHLMKFLAGGQASTNCVMGPGEIFCCISALDAKPYPAEAVAGENSVVVFVPMPFFQGLLRRHPDFLDHSLRLLCGRLRQVEEKSCMAYESVEQRLARVLLMLLKKFNATIPLTKRELAELAHTTQETAIRILGRFKKRGLIRSSRAQLTVLYPKTLASFVHSPS